MKALHYIHGSNAIQVVEDCHCSIPNACVACILRRDDKHTPEQIPYRSMIKKEDHVPTMGNVFRGVPGHRQLCQDQVHIFATADLLQHDDTSTMEQQARRTTMFAHKTAPSSHVLAGLTQAWLQQ